MFKIAFSWSFQGVFALSGGCLDFLLLNPPIWEVVLQQLIITYLEEFTLFCNNGRGRYVFAAAS